VFEVGNGPTMPSFCDCFVLEGSHPLYNADYGRRHIVGHEVAKVTAWSGTIGRSSALLSDCYGSRGCRLLGGRNNDPVAHPFPQVSGETRCVRRGAEP
jgi:hypothetical protein